MPESLNAGSSPQSPRAAEATAVTALARSLGRDRVLQLVHRCGGRGLRSRQRGSDVEGGSPPLRSREVAVCEAARLSPPSGGIDVPDDAAARTEHRDNPSAVREERPRPPVSAPGIGSPTSFPVSRSHILTFPSVLVVASSPPLGSNVTLNTHPLCPRSVGRAGGRWSCPRIDYPRRVARCDRPAVRREADRDDRVLVMDRPHERLPRDVPDRRSRRRGFRPRPLAVGAEGDVLQRALHRARCRRSGPCAGRRPAAFRRCPRLRRARRRAKR